VNAADNRHAYTQRVLMNSFLSARRRRWRGERPEATPPQPPAGDWADRMALRVSVQVALRQLSADASNGDAALRSAWAWPSWRRSRLWFR
jgi:hypothetical protein